MFYKSEYMEICKNLSLSTYLTEEDEFSDERIRSDNDLLVHMSYMIKMLEDRIEDLEKGR